ncbi:MAG TPA: DUF5615 family PIN-like protein [Egibacteraceae bacterium]|nr:DUF5615 family PIN-like protein [Egibacteraceae bacterium]
MKLLLDENFPIQLYRRLRQAGEDVEHLILSGQRGLPDDAIRVAPTPCSIDHGMAHSDRSATGAHDVEARLRERLAAEPDVLVAYLFGSSARGSSGPLSDVDVALLLAATPHGIRRLELIGAVAGGVGSERTDVLFLTDAPVSVAYRVLRDGRLLLSRDDRARVRHWVRTVDRYLDMAPARRALERGLRSRLAEGRFGRP